jgi:hypothetical protein
MLGKLRRTLFGCLLALAVSLVLAAPGYAATTTIGSSLRGLPGPGEGVCIVSSPSSASRTCSDTQNLLGLNSQAQDGLKAPTAGTIVRWSVRSGTASPSTVSVRLRLALLNKYGEVSAATPTPFVDLPLSKPGVHTFSARLPIKAGDVLALESLVRSNGTGPAYVPIVSPGLPEEDSILEWSPPRSVGNSEVPPTTGFPAEMLLNAEIDTDAEPPRTKLTYPQRQDFLGTKEVLVRFRSNEDATVFASGQLEFPNGKRGAVIYGLYGKQLQVEGGEKTTLRLRLPRKTWEAALRAQENGKRIVIKVTVSAEDAVGNRSGTTVAAIRPSR